MGALHMPLKGGGVMGTIKRGRNHCLHFLSATLPCPVFQDMPHSYATSQIYMGVRHLLYKDILDMRLSENQGAAQAETKSFACGAGGRDGHNYTPPPPVPRNQQCFATHLVGGSWTLFPSQKVPRDQGAILVQGGDWAPVCKKHPPRRHRAIHHHCTNIKYLAVQTHNPWAFSVHHCTWCPIKTIPRVSSCVTIAHVQLP